MDNQSLHDFIIRAKAASYVGDGQPSPSCRPGSHDLKFNDGNWTYLDSYFGGRDFIGEELVWYQGQPIWAMNYYGHILRADLLTPAQAGQVIKAGLSKMYSEGRFLGGYEYHYGGFIYSDASEGSVTHFRGREVISLRSETAYELFYHGGLILDD
jgi:hypothetical protein